MSDYGNVEVDVSHESLGEEAQPLRDVIAWLTEQLEKIPAEFRDGAQATIRGWDGDGWIRVTYRRPPTAKEIAIWDAEKTEQSREKKVREIRERDALIAKHGLPNRVPGREG